LTQSYDGDRLRVKKGENGVTTYYLRSNVFGGQVVTELNASGVLQRGYVYLGNELLALEQSNQVSWDYAGRRPCKPSKPRSRWSENVDIRAMLLTLIVVFGVYALKSAYVIGEANAFLLSGFVAVLVVYWIPPIPKETYIHWIGTHFVLLLGAFLFLFKVPSLFSSFLSYQSAQVLCILVYSICCWFLIRRSSRSPVKS
jgi:hypothetical protein